MDLDFLRLGWARFEFDIFIRLIPLLFGSNNYSNTVLTKKKFIFRVNTSIITSNL